LFVCEEETLQKGADSEEIVKNKDDKWAIERRRNLRSLSEMTKRKKEVIDVDCSEKKDFVIDWSSAMDKEDEVPELEIVNTTKPTPPPPPTFFSDDQTDSPKLLTDRDLDEQLERKKAILTLGPGLPDKGEKIRLKIADLEEEKQRRVLEGSKMVRILIQLHA